MKLVVADNQDLTRLGLERCLEQVPGAEMRRAADKGELSALLSADGRAVVVLDYALFDFAGPEQLLIFVRRFPEVRWLLLSAEFGRPLLRLLSAEPGVSFLLKDSGTAEVVQALSVVMGGGRHVSPPVCEQLAEPVRRTTEVLTEAEREVLRLVSSGHTAKQVAALRHCSVHTVITHKKNIFRKIEVNNLYEATRYALRSGIVDPIEYYI